MPTLSPSSLINVLRSCLLRPRCIALTAIVLTGCAGERELTQAQVDAHIEEGIELLQTFNFDLAYNAFSQAQPLVPASSTEWSKVTYSLGLAAWHKSPPSLEAIEEAKRHFTSVIEVDPRSEWAASALLDLGRIAEVADFNNDPTDVAEAQSYYIEARERFPNSDYSAKATLYLAQSIAQELTHESAQEAIELLVAEMHVQPDSRWFATMAQYTAQLYAFYLDDIKDSLTYYEKAWKAGFPRASEADLSLWQYALLAEKTDEALRAAEAYYAIITQYPRSLFGTLARIRLTEIAKQYPDANITIPPARTTSAQH